MLRIVSIVLFVLFTLEGGGRSPLFSATKAAMEWKSSAGSPEREAGNIGGSPAPEDSSLSRLNRSLNEARAAKDMRGECLLSMDKASLLWDKGQYQEALETGREALRIATLLGEPGLVADSKLIVAVCLSDLNMQEMAVAELLDCR